jgi:Holliday junction resolvase-like predicted endonuclease
MNKKNVQQLKGTSSEDKVLAFLTDQGWNVFTSRHSKGMADLVVYHEDKGCTTYQVKTLTRQGGKHVAPNGLVMEGKRPRVVLKLRDNKKRQYKENNIDWMVGVDPDTDKLYFYHYNVYKNYKNQLTIDTVRSVDHPEPPELVYFKNKNEITNLNEILD